MSLLLDDKDSQIEPGYFNIIFRNTFNITFRIYVHLESLKNLDNLEKITGR